jgi:hypothetical protein
MTNIIYFPVQDVAAETALQAIEQNQPALNADGGALAHVTNFPQTQAVSVATLPLPANAAADGTDGTGITPPAGAVGIRGWLSGIYKALSGTLAVSATALPLPNGAAADGTDATGVTAPAGGVGIRGWLSGIYAKLTGTLTVGGTVAVSGTVPVSGTFYQTTQPISASALPLPSGAATDVSLTNGNQKTQITSLPSLPTGSNVIGAVSVSNLPATQAISATTLPLPTGAAVESGGNLATIAGAQGAGGTSIAQPTGGSGLLGWLSGIYKAVTGTLAISAAALPLPAGAAADATLTNGNQKAQIVPAFAPTANSLAGTCAAAGTDYTALPANAARRFLMIVNTHASASLLVSLVGSTTATNAPLIPLVPGQGLVLDIAVPNTAVHVQSATAGATYSTVEG